VAEKEKGIIIRCIKKIAEVHLDTLESIQEILDSKFGNRSPAGQHRDACLPEETSSSITFS